MNNHVFTGRFDKKLLWNCTVFLSIRYLCTHVQVLLLQYFYINIPVNVDIEPKVNSRHCVFLKVQEASSLSWARVFVERLDWVLLGVSQWFPVTLTTALLTGPLPSLSKVLLPVKLCITLTEWVCVLVTASYRSSGVSWQSSHTQQQVNILVICVNLHWPAKTFSYSATIRLKLARVSLSCADVLSDLVC